ncbi:hypothetical protein BZG36_05071 [Bifiguratus adelaidae]|uniref:Phospholipase C n=1 Tax=Bifiguratus adelaidae TaxID=1938954 RepID=A0A261XVD6_9FUNG|nr:hypothetical protein BZG36_05071 [Bifiguratus adelaidae]
MKILALSTAIAAAFAALASASPIKGHKKLAVKGLENIQHIVYFMQENRAFDNYYGTMAGVRGFKDPNVAIQSNGTPFSTIQIPTHQMHLLPFRLSGNKAGCTAGGSNGWEPNHLAWNNGSNNNWPQGNSPHALGYLTREEIPFQFQLAEEFTIADMYFQSVMSSTNPNRVMWMSGTIQGPPGNTILEDNTESTPLGWSTFPQALTTAGVSWQVYQDTDNFDDNALAWFKHWQSLPNGTEKQKGLGFLGLQDFYDHAGNGTLPTISYIVGPTELSEHPDSTPMAGAWLQEQVVNAVMNSPQWNTTALFINYDESGGYFDHVIPVTPPKGDPAEEWVPDKFNNGALAPIGTGHRVPMVVVSPWTRGGNVFTEVSDHTSTLRFLEQYFGTNSTGGYKVPAENLSQWRRSTFGDLTGIFDFENHDYSVPQLMTVPKPAQTSSGAWDPTEMCENLPGSKVSMPYGNQSFPPTEIGAKKIRGAITLGRTLIFQSGKSAVQANSSTASVGSYGTTNKNAFFTLEQASSGTFYIKSVATGTCLTVSGNQVALGACSGAGWTINYVSAGSGYTLQKRDHYLNINGRALSVSSRAQNFIISSVTY